MPKLGRPTGSIPRKTNITRALSLPANLYKKCVWIADRWTRESLVESSDGSETPEYWSVPRVISAVLKEYFDHLENTDPSLTEYFTNCQARDAERKNLVSRSPTQPPSPI